MIAVAGAWRRDEGRRMEGSRRRRAVSGLGDRMALTRALTGVMAADLLIPPAHNAPDVLAAQAPIRDAIVGAIEDSGIGHVVFLSSTGAQHPVRGTRTPADALGPLLPKS